MRRHWKTWGNQIENEISIEVQCAWSLTEKRLHASAVSKQRQCTELCQSSTIFFHRSRCWCCFIYLFFCLSISFLFFVSTFAFSRIRTNNKQPQAQATITDRAHKMRPKECKRIERQQHKQQKSTKRYIASATRSVH